VGQKSVLFRLSYYVSTKRQEIKSRCSEKIDSERDIPELVAKMDKAAGIIEGECEQVGEQ